MLLGYYGFLYATLISIVLALEDVSHQDLESPNGKICRAAGSCTLGNASVEQFPKANCRCDSDCVKYGDCCLDAENFDVERQRRAVSQFSCVNVTALPDPNTRKSFIDPIWIYVKESCPPNWKDVETRRKCERSSKSISDQDPFLFTPVTNNKTNITYGNIYCAHCNRDASHFRHLTYWNLGLNCMNASKTPLDYTLNPACRDTLTYNEKVASWQINCENEIFNCSMVRTVPNEIRNRTRPCVNTIKTCPATWSDKDFRDRCEAYTIVVYDNRDIPQRRSQPYRNVHCGMCNNVPVHSLDCIDKYSSIEIDTRNTWISYDLPFSLLIDFRKKACQDNQVYDDFSKKCRDILSELRAQDCDTSEANCTTPPSPSPYISKFKPYFNILTALGIGISIICLCMHLVVFVVLKELRNLSGKNLASLCFSLLVAYCSFVISSQLEGRACFVNAVVTYYFFLAAFTWMLVMAFDVWRTLRIATTELRVSSGTQWRKFLIYSFCSWILPAKIVLIALLVELCPLTFVGEQFKPHFGQGTCWFGQGPAILVFFGVPLILILVCNVSFFLSSAYMIYSSHSMARYSASPNTKRDFRLYARLALIMGLTWITGIIAGFADNEILYVVFIVLNTSLGLFIFLAFTCRRKILHALKNLKRDSVLNLPSFSWSMNNSDDGKMSSSNISEKPTSNTYY